MAFVICFFVSQYYPQTTILSRLTTEHTNPLTISNMLKISGLIVPKLFHKNHDRDIVSLILGCKVVSIRPSTGTNTYIYNSSYKSIRL